MSSNAFMETKYLSDFILHRLRPVTGPITRSSNDSTLTVAHVGRNCIGDKSFYVTAPRLWIALPTCRNIREAKSLTLFKKDVEVSPLSKILTCFVFIFCFVFPPVRFDLDEKVRYKCLYVYVLKRRKLDHLLGLLSALIRTQGSGIPLMWCGNLF